MLCTVACRLQVLKVFPYPITITTFQFFVGAIVVQLMWLFGLYKRPNVTKEQVWNTTCQPCNAEYYELPVLQFHRANLQ